MSLRTLRNKYWDVNHLFGWAMSKKLPLAGIKWIEETFQFNKDLIKSCNDDEVHYLEVDIQYIENLYNLHDDLPCLLKRKTNERVSKLVSNSPDKNNVLYK